MTTKETYLGDGLYAHYDGFAVWLRAPRVRGDGTPEDHVVALEPQVFKEFIDYALSLERCEAILMHCTLRRIREKEKTE